jgi:glycosyltransferase involved in cell wall biosynthesis
LDASALRIVHVFRAPLGGLFRHVVDLCVEQASRGHQVGLFFDQGGDEPRVRAAIARIPGGAALGVAMAPIRRNPHLSDVSAYRAFARFVAAARPDVVHGHGSKGGVYARLIGGAHGAVRPIRVYTPHGGSFNYQPGGLRHKVYMQAERAIARRTDLFLFESAHIAGKYDTYVGVAAGISRVVVNGLGAREFDVATPGPDATDVLYVGELRAAKGVDTLLEALALIGRLTGTAPSATLVGSGPDRDMLIAQAHRLGLAGRVSFPGPIPVAEAFARGRVMAAPSRAESMPYIVLESVAAQMPLLTTDVGGVPEIFGPYRDRLLKPDDVAGFARAIQAELARPQAERAERAADLADYVRRRFSLQNMVEMVLSGYSEALDRRDLDARRSRDRVGAAKLVNGA